MGLAMETFAKTDRETDASRECVACGTGLLGPFKPRITLTMPYPGEPEEGGQELKALARGWFCPGCGLLQWYAEEENLGPLLEAAAMRDALTGKPDASYERRMHMLRMLRRVKRM